MSRDRTRSRIAGSRRPAQRRLVAALALAMLALTAVHGAGSPVRAPGAVDHGAASVCAALAHAAHLYAGREGDETRERSAARAGLAQWPPDDTELSTVQAPMPGCAPGGAAEPVEAGPPAAAGTQPPGRSRPRAPPA